MSSKPECRPGQVWRHNESGAERVFVREKGGEVTWRRPGNNVEQWCRASTWRAWVRGATLIREEEVPGGKG